MRFTSHHILIVIEQFNKLKIRIDLSDANLSGANLSGADLSGVNLFRANLFRANLFRANLFRANLFRAVGNMLELKSIMISTYNIVYTNSILQIGCENHTIDQWKNFTDMAILKMDGKTALTFWKKYKDLIFQIIKISPGV